MNKLLVKLCVILSRFMSAKDIERMIPKLKAISARKIKKASKPLGRSPFDIEFERVLSEIMFQNKDIKLYRSDPMSGGVYVVYGDFIFRVTAGIGYTVEVRESSSNILRKNHCISGDIAKNFYLYLQNKYECFTSYLPYMKGA